MSLNYTVTCEAAQAQQFIQAIKARSINAFPAMKVIAEQLRTMVVDTFRAEGARNGNQKWQELKPATVSKRMKRRKSFFSKRTGRLTKRGRNYLTSMKILDDRHRLFRSIKARASRWWAQSGTNIPYGPTHQMGDPTRNIPARPFVDVTQPDIDKASRTLNNYVLYGSVLVTP